MISIARARFLEVEKGLWTPKAGMSGTKPMMTSSQYSHLKEEEVQGVDEEKSSRGIMTRAHMFLSAQGRSILSETPGQSSRG